MAAADVIPVAAKICRPKLKKSAYGVNMGGRSRPIFILRKERKKMPCNLYNNNGFGCGGCKHFVRTTSVTLNGAVLELNIPQDTYSNKEKVCICVAQVIPEVTSADTVAITIGAGTTQYPLRTKCGNNVHADQIRSRKVYHTFVATDIPQFTVSGCELCRTGFNFPTIPAATPAG